MSVFRSAIARRAIRRRGPLADTTLYVVSVTWVAVVCAGIVACASWDPPVASSGRGAVAFAVVGTFMFWLGAPFAGMTVMVVAGSDVASAGAPIRVMAAIGSGCGGGAGGGKRGRGTGGRDRLLEGALRGPHRGTVRGGCHRLVCVAGGIRISRCCRRKLRPCK